MLAGRLTNKGILAKAYHAGLLSSIALLWLLLFVLRFPSGLPAKERSEIQQQWMQGKVPVIVATVSFGMGVDKSDVRYGSVCACVLFRT